MGELEIARGIRRLVSIAPHGGFGYTLDERNEILTACRARENELEARKQNDTPEKDRPEKDRCTSPRATIEKRVANLEKLAEHNCGALDLMFGWLNKLHTELIAAGYLDNN